MKKLYENPTLEEIKDSFENKDTIFLCPKLESREREYYETVFKQFAPEGSVSFLSSGSSGSPKIHVHSWENLISRAKSQAEILELKNKSTYLSPLPLHHLSGFMPVLRCIFSGSTLVIKPKFESLKDALLSKKPTHVSMVPTQLIQLVDEKIDLSFLDTLLLGGAGCSENYLNKARELNYPIRACYGMTETASFFSIGKKEEFLESGKIKLYLMKNWSASAQENGRLTIESKEMYLGSIGALGFKESNGILPTFDIGSVDHPVITIKGRSDLVFKSGGEKVDPLEVEKKLESQDSFNSVVIIPKDDEKWGSITCAFISPFRKGRDYSLTVENLPPHQRPKFFFPLGETTGIKPKRSNLKKQLEENFFNNSKLPRVAFIHGFMGSENDLKELADSLREVCFPKFWRLPFHEDNSDYESFESVVDYFVEKVRTEDIDCLYGYSMGGRLATAIASKLEDLGEPLSALFLESSHPGLTNEEEKSSRYTSDLTLFDRLPHRPEDFFHAWYSQDLFGDFKDTELGKITIREMERRWNPDSWKKSLKVLSTGKQQNYQRYLTNSSHPILYMCGENDRKYSSISEKLSKSSPKNLITKSLKHGYHNLHCNHGNQLKGPISEVLNSLN